MRQTLATRFVLITSGIAALGLLNGLVAMLFTWSVANVLRSAIRENLPSIRAAQELEIALSDQKGLVSAYILAEQDVSWLERLRKAEAAFAVWLALARTNAHTPEENQILDRLEQVGAEYRAKHAKTVLQFDRDQRNEAIATLLHEVWPTYDRAYQLCEEFIEANEGYVEGATARAERYIGFAAWGVSIGSLGTGGLAMALLWLLIRRVLFPLRRMVADARGLAGSDPRATAEAVEDELRSVGVHFRALMADVAEARTAVAESRSRMLRAEKLASVGKLAASVAHEMRNPLSSMKMWLYSLRKTATADPALDRKLGILGDEITRLESIVRNFLEFSRPPALKLQPQSIVPVVEKTLELAGPWLDTRNVRVLQRHSADLPHVAVDAEQLQQVFSNLLHNAAEAMPGGGEISISSAPAAGAGGSSFVVVRVQDAGQGIPDDVRSHLFEPFFTTKDEGTGLGLCIAANIMARHGGQLVLESSASEGTTFAVRIPAATENRDEQDSRR